MIDIEAKACRASGRRVYVDGLFMELIRRHLAECIRSIRDANRVPGTSDVGKALLREPLDRPESLSPMSPPTVEHARQKTRLGEVEALARWTVWR